MGVRLVTSREERLNLIVVSQRWLWVNTTLDDTRGKVSNTDMTVEGDKSG